MAASSASDFSEASLNTLQLALRTMKERCRGQEARIGELEDDNSHLRADRSVRRCFSISVPNYVRDNVCPVLSNFSLNVPWYVILGYFGFIL